MTPLRFPKAAETVVSEFAYHTRFNDTQRYTALEMSVVGVDFGTLNTVIAVARNRGVDVVCAAPPSTYSISFLTFF